MGAPPQHLATAGRANPSGIPYLYLSRSLETTIYETRSGYLDLLSVARFNPKGEELNIVDFTIHPSIFNDEQERVEIMTSRLLKDAISQDLSKPMRRYDSELEYIPTQFICEYIRYTTGVDGIQFNSSLHKVGVNIVLFDPDKVECKVVEVHHVSEVLIVSGIKEE